MASKLGMLKSFVNHFEESLICTVCLDVPSSSPIYQCENGHLLCKNCWPKLNRCPSCQKRLTSNRNLLAEQMLEKLLIPCQNQGCEEKVIMVSGQTKHDKDCLYLAFKCLIPNCEEITCKAKLIEHNLKCHYVQSVSENTFSGRMMLPEGNKFESQFQPVLITFGTIHFFVQVTSKCKLYYIWVYCIGDSATARQAMCDIKIQGSRQAYSMKGPCLSIEMSQEEIMESDSVLVLTETVFESLLKRDDGNNKYLDMEVSVSQRKQLFFWKNFFLN